MKLVVKEVTMRSRSLGLQTVVLSLALSCFVAGCSTAQQRPAPSIMKMTAQEILAVSSRVVDCEWKAANRYDDGRSSVSELAQRVLGICAVELIKARQAFGFSQYDPQLDLDEFKQAVENVESARKSRVDRR